MSELNKLILLGYSGHAYVVIDVARSMGLNVIGYLDREKNLVNPYELEYLGDEKDFILDSVTREGTAFFAAVGDNSLRQKLGRYILNNGWFLCKLFDKSAIVSGLARVSDGTLIAPLAVINSLVKIGIGCIINTGAIIEHECQIADFAHIAPGAVLAGNVEVGERCFIGAGAVIKQGVKIAGQVTVGAGAVVINDIPFGETWAGNPARRIK